MERNNVLTFGLVFENVEMVIREQAKDDSNNTHPSSLSRCARSVDTRAINSPAPYGTRKPSSLPSHGFKSQLQQTGRKNYIRSHLDNKRVKTYPETCHKQCTQFLAADDN